METPKIFQVFGVAQWKTPPENAKQTFACRCR